MDPFISFLNNIRFQLLIPPDQKRYKQLFNDPTSFQTFSNPKHFYHGQEIKIVLALFSQERQTQKKTDLSQNVNEEPPASVVSLFNQIHIFIEAQPKKTNSFSLLQTKLPTLNLPYDVPCSSILSHPSLNSSTALDEPYLTIVEPTKEKEASTDTIKSSSPLVRSSGCVRAWFPESSHQPVRIFKHNGAWAGLYPITIKLGSGDSLPMKESLQLEFILGRPKPPRKQTPYKWTLPSSYLANSSWLDSLSSDSLSSDDESDDSNTGKGIAFGALNEQGEHDQILMFPGRIYQANLSMSPTIEVSVSTQPQNQISQTRFLVTVSTCNGAYSPTKITLEDLELSSSLGSIDLVLSSILPLTLLKSEEANLIFYYDLKNPLLPTQNDHTSPSTMSSDYETNFLHDINLRLKTRINDNKKPITSNYRLELNLSAAQANFSPPSCTPQPPFSPIPPIPSYSDRPTFHRRNTSSLSSGTVSVSSLDSKTSLLSANSMLGKLARNLTSFVPQLAAIPSFGEVLESPSSEKTTSPDLNYLSRWQPQDELVFTLQVEDDVKLGDPCQLQVTVVNKSPKVKLLSLFFPSSQELPAPRTDISPLSTVTKCSTGLTKAPPEPNGSLSPNPAASERSVGPPEIPFWGLSDELALARYVSAHAMLRMGGMSQNNGGRFIATRPVIPFAKLSPGSCQSIMVPVYPLSHLSTNVSPLGVIDHEHCRNLSLSSAYPLIEILPSH